MESSHLGWAPFDHWNEAPYPPTGPVALQPGGHFFYFLLISPTPFLTGILPNITRNAIVNCGEMVTYDIIKEKLLDYHLLTGEALGSRQIALPQSGGDWDSTEWAPPTGNWALEGVQGGTVPSTSLG